MYLFEYKNIEVILTYFTVDDNDRSMIVLVVLKGHGGIVT